MRKSCFPHDDMEGAHRVPPKSEPLVFRTWIAWYMVHGAVIMYGTLIMWCVVRFPCDVWGSDRVVRGALIT